MLVVGLILWGIIVLDLDIVSQSLNQANLDGLKLCLETAHRLIRRMAQELPDQDAYSIVYTVLVDLNKAIDASVVSLNVYLPQAEAEVNNNPEQLPNRAKVWCKAP